MNIIAIAVGSYPLGQASTNRNISILKGLAESKNHVELLILSPTRKLTRSRILKEGIIEGVKFRYTSRSVLRPKNFIGLFGKLLLSIFKALKIINSKNKSEKVDAIILLITEPTLMHPFILYAKKYNINIYGAEVETPEIRFKEIKLLTNIRLKYYLNMVKKLRGLYVMNNYLKNYFSNIMDENKICLVNMTVDHTRFIEMRSSPFNFKYIAYCGTMYGNKDGLKDLINAYEMISDKVPLKLVLIGDILDERAKYVKEIIKEKKMSNNILLTGSIESTDIPKYLMNAEMLVLCRPNNIQAKGGFPTKLGEYLLTNKPTIVTAVGDIPTFFTNEENIYLVQPDNPTLFAEKMLYVYNNYQLALNVATKGKEIALKNFNYFIEARKLETFMMQHNA